MGAATHRKTPAAGLRAQRRAAGGGGVGFRRAGAVRRLAARRRHRQRQDRGLSPAGTAGHRAGAQRPAASAGDLAHAAAGGPLPRAAPGAHGAAPFRAQ